MKPQWAHRGAYILLLILWALLVIGARSLSLSMDEPTKIVAGYTFLARGGKDLWFLPLHGHPPLVTIAEASLIFLTQPHIPLETLGGWGESFIAYTDSFLPYLMPLERAAMLARVPVMLSTALLGALVFRWGKEISNAWGGWLALGLLCFDPLILAHGRLVNTDIGVTLFGTTALYAGWRWLKQPRWRWSVAAGVLAGLTLLSKFSGFLWVIALGLMAGGIIAGQYRQGGLQRVAQATTAGLLALLLVWAAFGFSVGAAPQVPIPLPAPAYWTAFLAQQSTATERIFIAFGQLWRGPQWWYFPLNFLIKNPLPLLIAFLLGGLVFIRHARNNPYAMILPLFPLLYTIASVSGGMNVSYRHMLPVHPFLYLMAAGGLTATLAGIRRRQSRLRRWPVWVGSLLSLWYIGGTLRLFPDELTYFNELVGGPEKGHRYLVDYTQDWGQAFEELDAYLRAHPGPEPQVFYFTNVHPDAYGISSQRLWHVTPFHPQPGRYVLGPAPLYGLVGPDPQGFNWFLHASPTAMVGHSLFVYDVTEQPTWIAQCTIPNVPLEDTAIDTGFGRAPLRRADFDCTSAWLYPPSEQTIGVYALHHALLEEQRCGWFGLLRCDPIPVDPFVSRHLSDARLSYEQQYNSDLPAFALYERKGAPLPPSPHPTLLAAPAESSPLLLQANEPISTPVTMTGPLTFLGAAAYRGSDGLEVETWWLVASGPVTRPFSLMAHLITNQGELLSVADGLGIYPTALATGDIVVQRHRFASPPDGEFWLRTGAYWLDTMERWAVSDAPGADALFLPLRGE